MHCPALALAKLYANMMVTSLNNRAFLQRSRTGITAVSMNGESSTLNTQRGGSGGSAATETMVRVNVITETDSKFGDDYPMKNLSVSLVNSERIGLCVLT